jgi:hypothetical protein
MEGKTVREMNPKWKEEKKHLDREEKKLGKIADKNTTIKGIKSKVLKNQISKA